MADHLRHQDITTDHGEVGRRLFDRRLLHQPGHFHEVAARGPRRDHAIARDLRHRHFLDRHDIPARLGIGIRQLLHAGDVAEHQVVRQHHGEGLVAHEAARAPDGVAEAERHLLAGRDDGAGRQRLGAEHLQLPLLVPLRQGAFQLIGQVELVHEHRLAAPGDEAELLDAGRARLLHRVLDEGLVHHRQHFLGHLLGGGQKSGSEAGNRQHGLAERLWHGR